MAQSSIASGKAPVLSVRLSERLSSCLQAGAVQSQEQQPRWAVRRGAVGSRLAA